MKHPPPPAPRAAPILAIALLLPLLGGCAEQTSTRYPSLLPRAIETRSDVEATVAIPVAQADPVTDAALETLRQTLDKTAAAFAPAALTAERLATAAQGAAAGSERWIAAQTALADLDAYRATTSATLTDLDSMAVARAADGKPDYPAITALRTTTQNAYDAQAARIAAISARLPTG